MPIVRLVAEGVGPFERLDLDLSDGKGNPHLGPHILAGVNGCGKSTALHTLAWVMDRGRWGFPYDDWQHALAGYADSRGLLLIKPPGFDPYIQACTKRETGRPGNNLRAWVRSELPGAISDSRMWEEETPGDLAPPGGRYSWLADVGPVIRGGRNLFNIAAYAPSRSLKYLPNPYLSKALPQAFEDCLAFESTVRNEAIQAWLLGLYSKRAIARERKQPTGEYTRSLERFESSLELIYGQAIAFEVDLEPTLQPRLRVLGQSLNFSQLPEGARGTVGWLADFMMRQDLVQWNPELKGKRPGILLLDEVDAHLHPLWQRRLLPAMRAALPDVQIIVTSHSPFVISSCPGSRVHVLELEANGRAHARPPVDAPIGESIATTLKEIFGVESRFDVQTEKELNEWYELKRDEANKRLSRKETTRLKELQDTLSARSEELRALVAPAILSPEVVRSLKSGGNGPTRTREAGRRASH